MPAEVNNKKVLLLTLVHPDFLPPVYAIGQVLRDEGYLVHILTFDSFVPSEFPLGDNIIVESAGRHYDAGIGRRMKLRNEFRQRALQLAGDSGMTAVFTFCPFSFHIGIVIKASYRLPLIYHALEIADFKLRVFLRSPLSNYRNLRALQTLDEADMLATPSAQRSAWLAGRRHLTYMPHTILNTAYIPKDAAQPNHDAFRQIVPTTFLDKKIILYTGAVNSDLCTMELVQAFAALDDENSALIITGIKDTDYCKDIAQAAEESRAAKRIKLFPYVTRMEMMSLQSHAHIGACLSRESQNNVKSKMIAPNKAGEYLAKDLYLLGILSEYLRPVKMQGIVSLSETCSPTDIAIAMKEALQAVNDPDYKLRIRSFVTGFFCMQQQLKPIIKYLNDLKY